MDTINGLDKRQSDTYFGYIHIDVTMYGVRWIK